MLYLTTGANGTGKTLLTIKLVRELSEKEGRPVCYNGRFDLNADGPLKTWKRVDIQDWQAEPDGTIFVVDECHNDFPIRGNGAAVPEYVRMLAEHRKRGFDFYMMTQHPQNIDVFVRRLIGNPGWHRHLKRMAGAALVSQSQWDAVNPQCERPGSGESGQITLVPYPKEVYGWYHSAQLHTAKVKIPRAVFVLGACALAVPLLFWFGFHKVRTSVAKDDAAALAPAGRVVESRPPVVPSRVAAKPGAVVSAQEFAEAQVPRLAGLPWTAPRYDSVTQPTEAPFPAACVESAHDCKCFTQQATRIGDMPQGMCHQIAMGGFFQDWRQPVAPVAGSSGGAQLQRPGAATVAAAAAAAAPAVVPARAAASAPAMLSAPGDTAPQFFPAVADAVATPSAVSVQDGSAWRALRSGGRVW